MVQVFMMTTANYHAIMRKSHFAVSSVAGEMTHVLVMAQFPVDYVIEHIIQLPL